MRRSSFWLVVAAAALLLVLTACNTSIPTFVEKGDEYDRSSAMLLTEKVEDPELAEVPVEQGATKRHDALASLRSKGEAAADAARVITKVFPPDATGVPYYVELASYEGTSAIVILEAIGPKGGMLADKRLWVLSDTGNVLLSGTR